MFKLTEREQGRYAYAIFFYLEEKWKIKYVTMGIKQDGSRFDHQYAFFSPQLEVWIFFAIINKHHNIYSVIPDIWNVNSQMTVSQWSQTILSNIQVW